MNKQERIKVYKNTVEIVNKGTYTAPNGEEIKINGLNSYMMENTKFYGKKINIEHSSLPHYETEIKVVDNDCIYEAKKLIDEGLNPALLNMASFATPGGGVINGSGAQEENIFRRTNLFKSLYQFHYVGENYNVKQREERYPLDYNFGGIYTPKVTVLKQGEDKNYELLNETFLIDVISIAALKNPRLDENGIIVPWAKKTIKNKIKQLIDIALENGNDSLILSAFGCGAYKTPPKQMAMIFADVLASEEYRDLFKKIHFAIIETPSTNGTHNPQGNYKPFKEVFG